MRVHVFIIVLLQYYLCKISSYYIEERRKSILNVICEHNKTLDENMLGYPKMTIANTINFVFCPPPTISLARTLAQHKIRVSAVRKLIVNSYGERLLTPIELQGLQIEELSLRVQTKVYLQLDVEVLNPRYQYLRELKVLVLNGFHLPPLPAASKFTKITLEYGRSTGELGGCRHLEELVLRKWAVPSIPGLWRANCQNLRHLTIDFSTPEEVEKILQGIKNITHLAMNNCGLHFLPMAIENLSNLEKLDVAHNNFNYISTIDYNSFFEKLKGLKLKELILDSNQISNCEGFSRKPIVLPDMINISVSDNQDYDLCNKICYNYGATRMPALKRLTASYTSTSRLCFGSDSLKTMEHLDFRKSEITFVQFKDMPLTSAKNLRIVDLRGNPIRGLSLQKTEYENLPIGMTVLGVNMTVECDCQNAWLARAVRNKRLSIGAQCPDHTALGDWPADQFECDRYPCDACTCRRAWRDNTTVARCGGGLHALPRLEGVREIHASSNLITEIGSTELPQTLTFLDLSSNHISRISAAELEVLFAGGRAVRLAGNPFVCDCEARELVQALRTHYAQVEDYAEITCTADQRNVSLIDPDEMCVETLRDDNTSMWRIGGPLIGAVSLACLLAALLTAVYFRYKPVIKMFLYVHGYCLWCVREDDVDGNRPYDAFVSFSHLDDAFVSEHLLPGLEEERGYRLCVHYRDWVVGEWISTQISQSVDLSRRVIIVLSKNFMLSTWALLEFRLAQMRSLKEKRNITIVVIIDDVLEDVSMNSEIRGYLAMTTYVKWGDPWFWRKLTLALPHLAHKDHDQRVEVDTAK